MKLLLRRIALSSRATVLMVGLLLGLSESRDAPQAATPRVDIDLAAVQAHMPVVTKASWELLFVGR